VSKTLSEISKPVVADQLSALKRENDNQKFYQNVMIKAD
jgi:hypothetical protein